jgi:hypothetical protein
LYIGLTDEDGLMPGPFNTALINLFAGYNSRIYNTGDPNEITSARLMLADANALPDIGSPSGVTTQFGSGVALDSSAVVRVIQNADLPCLGAGETPAPQLVWTAPVGSSWIVDASLTFAGAALYAGGLTVGLAAVALGFLQEVYSGPAGSNATVVTYPNRVSGAGSGSFGTFVISADANNITVSVHAAYEAIQGGVWGVQFAPVVAGAGNVILRGGSTLEAVRVS